MSKAITGAIELAAVGAMVAVMPAGALSLTFLTGTTSGQILSGLALMGIGTELGALSDALKSGPGTTVVTRQSAAPQQVVYGETRVDGSLVWDSTTGGRHGQLNRVHVWCSHQVQQIRAIYLDGKLVVFDGALGTNWGNADGNDHLDLSGNTYNFGGGTKTYVEHRYGYPGQLVRDNSGALAPTNYISGLTANDARWSATCNLFGHAYSYIKCTYDANLYAGPPQAKAVIQGKNNILDPRTNTRGYTNNAALVIADYLTSGRLNDSVRWGFRISWEDIDIDELIASANVCDESVASSYAAEGYERRYTINGSFRTDSDPGSILQGMLDACAGRAFWCGGKLKIVVGYDRGVSFSIDEGDVTGAIEWSSKHSYRDLFNYATGTFVSPRYPYNPVGNGLSANVPQPGIFDGMWQVADLPPYYLSYARGYAQYPLYDPEGNPVMVLDDEGNPTSEQQVADAFMADDCERLISEFKFQFVTSCGQGQRLLKQKLMRHRLQGSGKIPLKLSGFRFTAADNGLVNFAPLGWVNKEVEISSWALVYKEPDGSPLVETEIEVVETDPASIYAWSVSEERPMNAVDSYPGIASSAALTQPTMLILESGAETAVTTSDGIVRPRVLASWVAPQDEYVTSGGWIAVQYSLNGGTTFRPGPLTYGDATYQYIDDVRQGQSVIVRIASVSSRGSKSAWVTAGPHVVSSLQSIITTAALNPNAANNVGDTARIDSIPESGAATIRVYDKVGGDGAAWTFYRGTDPTSVPSTHFTGKSFSAVYYICYDVSTGDMLCFDTWQDTLNDNYYYLGVTVTCAADYDPGTGTGDGGTVGGGGSRCFEEGTLIHTSAGVIPNTELFARWKAGEAIQLLGGKGFEEIAKAEWSLQRSMCFELSPHIDLPGASFVCSISSKLLERRSGEYVRVTDLRGGDEVMTLGGWWRVSLPRYVGLRKVLSITMAGPTHEYFVGVGLRTHNMKAEEPLAP